MVLKYNKNHVRVAGVFADTTQITKSIYLWCKLCEIKRGKHYLPFSICVSKMQLTDLRLSLIWFEFMVISKKSSGCRSRKPGLSSKVTCLQVIQEGSLPTTESIGCNPNIKILNHEILLLMSVVKFDCFTCSQDITDRMLIPKDPARPKSRIFVY